MDDPCDHHADDRAEHRGRAAPVGGRQQVGVVFSEIRAHVSPPDAGENGVQGLRTGKDCDFAPRLG